MKNKKIFFAKLALLSLLLILPVFFAQAIVSEDGCTVEETACTKDGQTGHCRAYESFGEERIGCYIPVIKQDGCVNEEDTCTDSSGISGHCRQYESFGEQYMGCYTVSGSESGSETGSGTGSGSGASSSGGSTRTSSSGSTTTSGGLVIPSTNLPSPPGGIRQILANLLMWILGIFGMLAILAFVVSGIQYFAAAGDEKMMETAKRNLIYSIIGVVVALSGFVIIMAVDTALRGGYGI